MSTLCRAASKSSLCRAASRRVAALLQYYDDDLRKIFNVYAAADQGDFSGDARTINDDGDMVAGTLQGIWKRNGKIVTMWTLDQFSNGDMIYAKGKVDLVQGTMSFTAYPIP